MEHSFPCRINGEKELEYYEEYLNKNDGAADTAEEKTMKMTVSPPSGYIDKALPPPPCKDDRLCCYLKTAVGKLVRVESVIGGCLESRVGTLLKVGEDFIVIKLWQSCSTMICEKASVRYITVIHDNDVNKIGLY